MSPLPGPMHGDAATFDARTQRVSGADPGGITSTNGSPA